MSKNDIILVKLRIGELIEDERHLIHINDSKGYPVYKSDLDKILDKMREQEWARQDEKAVELGMDLYQHLDGDGIITEILQKARSSGKPILFKAQVPQQWDSLPLELLYKDHMLFLNRNIHLVWEVSDRAEFQTIESKTQSRLKMLFMAASDEQDKSTLNYEVEEEKIYEATKKFSLDLEVEESGSLSGLESSIYEHKPEIIHITGHATVSPEIGPVFLLETEEGAIQLVTPKMLWETMQDHPPTLLFLSGCSTGKSDRITGAYSFAREMVELGCPLVLGWSLPVQDTSATIFATALYESLSKENTLHKAISIARNKSDEYIKTARKANPGLTQAWPLLKVFTQASQFRELVKLDNPKTDHKPAKEVHYEQLGNKGVRVLLTGFIGRRRAIQKGLRVLRGKQQGKYGLFIHGPGGVGKSCLSGKLLAKFPDHFKIIFHGELTTSLIFEEIGNLSKQYGWDAWQQILEQQISDEEKIGLFFQHIGANQKILFLLDDFEQNLEQNSHGDWKLKEENQPVITALLNAVPIGNWSTQILITSRYSFTQFDEQGKNASDVLHDLPLSSFNPAEQRKKLRYLPHIVGSENKELYLKYAGGNARLLDMLESSVAIDEANYDTEALEAKINETRDETRAEYLGDIIASVEGSAFKSFMQKVAVFRIPVPAEAIAPIGNTETLERAVALTLVEKDISDENQAKYVVNNLVREYFWEQLFVEEQKEVHGVAWRWYKTQNFKGLLEEYEGLNHAKISGDIIGMIGPALNIAHTFRDENQPNEWLKFLDKHIPILENHIEKTNCNWNEDIGYIFNSYAAINEIYGNLTLAKTYFNKYLILTQNENSDQLFFAHNNLGGIYYRTAEYDKALEHFLRALDLFDQSNGNELYLGAILNNIGEVYSVKGENDKALYYLKKALGSDKELNGEMSTQVATRYNNIGLHQYRQKNLSEAIKNCEMALKIKEANFGTYHQDVAKCLKNLATYYLEDGNSATALKLANKCLEIDIHVFGIVNSATADTLIILSKIYEKKNEIENSVKFAKKAFLSILPFFTEDEPAAILIHEQFSSILKKSGVSDVDDYILKLIERVSTNS